MKKILLSSLFAITMLVSCDKKNETGTTTNDSGATPKETVAKPTPPKAEGTVRVLFVGNSHTEFFVSYPKMLEALCKENGKNVEVLTLVEMGVGIDEVLSANKSKADKMFAQTDTDGNYIDYVIMQEATRVSVQEDGKFSSNTKMLHDLIVKNSPGVATYVYQLMTPLDIETSDFKTYQPQIVEIVKEVAKSLPNAGVVNFADVLTSAYEGKEGYVSKKDGADLLRFSDSSKHALNDAVFLNSIVLYQYLFGETPKIPQQLPLSTGTSDSDEIKLMDVSKGVSNPEALLKIATSFK
ncbi:hypothetical protein EG240_09880 [Paenimyroides tangerinum]|uniref:Lipoprotein n=1 Tax=Paenimyroides tangerinum TaxID=2488728 RepID=A0A3P3W8W2_9FLAO|nr:hypothetical protein [Paenimyroides tangerinum]RRJ90049.1 hypothetical protein EG240_09880 [Paenimyroides tangerinum]